MGCRRSQPLETARRSSDGGRRSYVICRKEEEEREDQKTPGDEILWQTSHERGTACNNWRGSPRTGDIGEKSCMNYAPGGAKGLST